MLKQGPGGQEKSFPLSYRVPLGAPPSRTWT